MYIKIRVQWNLHGFFCTGLGDSCWGLEVGNLEMVDESSGVGEMCRGDAITGDKLDGAEGMRGVGVS